MQLEQSLYESRPISRNGLRVYQIGDLESLSASALYTGLPKFNDVPMYGNTNNGPPVVGTSSFNVQLPKSNAIDKSLRISTPEGEIIANQTKRIKGSSGIDYFNIDGSLAGRLLGLNKSELDSLEDQ